jgi:PAS domain-containing protein
VGIDQAREVRTSDITEEILNQHHLQRRMFAQLDEIDPADVGTLAVLWDRLGKFLEVHAAAEEIYFYPRVLELGAGPPDEGTPEDETKDAIKDHNEIRDAIAEAGRHQVGSDAWWAGVRAARKANDEHMAEEEQDDLADFRRHVDLEIRHEIAVDFVAYEARHSEGVVARDQDPDAYVQHHARPRPRTG